MFNLKAKKPTELDETIASLYSRLSVMDPESEDYDAITTQLVKLQKLKKDTEPSMPISPETLATIGANLLGIILILNFERGAIVTSKAVGFVKRLV